MSVVTEVGAGTLLIAGLLTPLACAAVISVMLVAGLLATFWRPKRDAGPSDAEAARS